MALANQFSYILISIVGIAVILFAVRGVFKPKLAVILSLGLVLVIVALALFFVLRPGTGDVTSLEEAERILANGQPTLVEFFSNYCAGCMGVRPTVDALVADLNAARSGGFNVLRVDIHTDFGRTLRERYGFTFTPEFILFDHSGEEVWRGHAPPTLNEIERLVPARG